MKLEDFDYALPQELIAQMPAEQRTASRLLHLDGASGELRDLQFPDIIGLIAPQDLIVLNDTRVIKARLMGRKKTGGRLEVLIERVLAHNEALVQMRVSHPPAAGTAIGLADALEATVVERRGGFFRLRFEGCDDIFALLERHGSVPLPPYIEHVPDAQDEARYQTVYARQPGAVAAPTAGLHFDEALLGTLRARGNAIAYVTLHVGAGTFQPVRMSDLAQHEMHSEWFEVPQATVDAIAKARARGGHVLAVGTTTLRALETAGAGNGTGNAENGTANAGNSTADAGIDTVNAGNGTADAGNETANAVGLQAGIGETKLFVVPGYRFRVVDRLVTNFHLPKSTLLMLVSAFGGVAPVRRAYQHAIEKRYRFYSYGDAMLIERAEH